MRTCLALAAAWLLCTPARASDDPPSPAEDPPADTDALDDFAPAPPGEDQLPEALATRSRIIPDTSFEFAFQYSWGNVAYLDYLVPPGPGLGLRVGWGKHLGVHRLGVAVTTMLEGQLGAASLHATEAVGSWDYVGANGLVLGAGLGGTFVLVHLYPDTTPRLAPTVTARVGGSQTWSRYQRRLFVFLEGKLRMAEGDLIPIAALVVGAGRGAGEYRPR